MPTPDEALARLLIDSLHDEAVYAIDPAGRVSTWSRGAETVLGYPAGEAVGLHVSAFYPQEEIQLGAPGRDLRRAETGGRDEMEGWRLRKGGERFWAFIATTVLRDAEGRTSGYARVVRDITERLRTEEALRFSEAKFSGIVSIASEAIVSVDESQRIVLFNKGAEQIFGYASGEAVGRPLELLIPEEQHAVHREHIEQFGRSSVVARRMGERGDVTILGRRKNGEVFPLEASISKMEIGGERLYTSVLRDVTERRRIERELSELLESERAARSAAEAATQARDDVLRIVSHDLGNSLSGILVTTRVLLKTLTQDVPAEETRRRIEGIRHLAEQMQRLRQDLLDVSRIEAGQLSIVPERHDPATLIDEVFHAFEPVVGEAGLRLDCSVEGEPTTVLADRERVLQVLSNLVGNAIKFTPAGGTIEVSAAARDAEEVWFAVTDSGVGISPQDLPHVFDRFWQARSSNRAGAGLGLAIAKGIVEAHGGRILVTSGPGEGSSFRFSLPAS